MKRLAMILCALTFAAPALAQDASGKWQLTVTPSGREPRTTSMALKKDGEKLSGTLIGPQDREIVVEGTQSGADVTLGFTVQTQNGPIAIAMKGRQDGETMKGTLRIGTDDQGDWSASRAAAPPPAAADASKVDVSGTWAFQVTTEAGTGSPTVTLKQDGEKLTGRYSGMFGEAPLTGQIKDKAFSFKVTMTIQGNDVTLTYSGTIDQSSASGRVTFGDLAEGTFTGKKQQSGAK